MVSSITSGIITEGSCKMAERQKVRENRLRRMAERQGLALEKSRRRDPYALDYGTYQIVDPDTSGLVASGLDSGFGMTLDEVEKWLTSK